MGALSPRILDIPERMKTALMQYLGAVLPSCSLYFSSSQNTGKTPPLLSFSLHHSLLLTTNTLLLPLTSSPFYPSFLLSFLFCFLSSSLLFFLPLFLHLLLPLLLPLILPSSSPSSNSSYSLLQASFLVRMANIMGCSGSKPSVTLSVAGRRILELLAKAAPQVTVLLFLALL